MPEQDGAENRVENQNEHEHEHEQRTNGPTFTTATPPSSTGSLRVEDRSHSAPRGLAAAFESRGWPGERATLDWPEYQAAVEFRTLTVSGSVDTISQVDRQGVALGFDSRHVYPVFPTEPVERDVTSVHVIQQSLRSLAASGDVIRDIDAVTTKPETSSTVDEVTVSLKQVASVQSNISNIYLEQPAFRTVIEQDLRHALDGGLDKLALDAIATAGFQAPGSDELLVSIRKARTVVESNGYSPNLLILRPQDSETLDTLVSGITGAANDYVFQPASTAPATIYGMAVRIAKNIPAPAVVDATAFGRMFISPVSLERFESDAGLTNRSNVRLECHAAFGTERVEAACRVAAS